MRCLCSTSSTITRHWCCDSSIGRVNIARKGLLHAAAGKSDENYTRVKRKVGLD